ncbi:hypothetical protein [Arthrobacter sp. ES1]|uniref:hypothetical protein n=1 Tax=Arthrobacter sp. ES1 TaxID=1897056 RepID=UPI001D00062B|nr:hypothetical protein [Arthrobacter sp. ES1]MCB5280582.1 hypothetical protein [Arthrobacter sp. ES1]
MTIMTLALDTNAACDLDGYRPGSHFPEAAAIDDRIPADNEAGCRGNTLFPLSSVQAEDLMDRDGNLTVTLLLDQERYFKHVITAAQGDAPAPEDYAHAVAYGFGRPRECVTRILGTSGGDFIVSYSTHIREFLDD